MGGTGEHCYLGHEEIVYFGETCPLCEQNARIAALEDIVDDLLRDTEV